MSLLYISPLKVCIYRIYKKGVVVMSIIGEAREAWEKVKRDVQAGDISDQSDQRPMADIRAETGPPRPPPPNRVD